MKKRAPKELLEQLQEFSDSWHTSLHTRRAALDMDELLEEWAYHAVPETEIISALQSAIDALHGSANPGPVASMLSDLTKRLSA